MDSFMAHFNCIQLFSMSWQKWLGGTISRSGDILCIKMLENNEDRMQITNNCSSHSGPRPSQRLWCTIRPALLAEAFILLIRALEQRASTSNRNCPFIQIMDGPSCQGGIHGMGGLMVGGFFGSRVAIFQTETHEPCFSIGGFFWHSNQSCVVSPERR